MASHETMGPVAGYIRVSTEEQGRRLTPELQRQAIISWAERHNVEIYDFYYDEISGRVAPLSEREGGSALLEDAKRSLFTHVVVFKLDRLARNLRNLLNDIKRLEEMQVGLVSTHENIDTSDSLTGKILVAVLGILAEVEADMIKTRTAGAKENKAREGVWINGNLPYGYCLDEHRKLSPYFPEAKIVQEIFRRVAEGEPIGSIIRDLKRRGVRITRKTQKKGETEPTILKESTNWFTTVITNILKNPVYKGTIHYGEIFVDDAHVGLVSTELWERINSTRQTRGANRTLYSANESLVSGLLTCGECGERFYYVPQRQKGRIYEYYKCGSLRNNSPRHFCGAKALPVRAVDENLWSVILHWIHHPEEIQELVASSAEEFSSTEEELVREERLLAREIQQKGEEKQEVLTLARKRLINQVDLERQLISINGEEEEITHKLSDVRSRLSQVRDIQQQESAVVRQLRELREREKQGFSTREKKRIVRQLLRSGLVITEGEGRDKSARIEYLWRFDPEAILIEGEPLVFSEGSSRNPSPIHQLETTFLMVQKGDTLCTIRR